MRQRRIKNLEEKTAAFASYIVGEPSAAKGRWAELFEERRADRRRAGSAEGSAVGGNEEPAAIVSEAPEAGGGCGPTTGGHHGSAAVEEPSDGQRDAPEIYMEIGSGKGRFITTLAEKNPDKLFIGVEGAESVVLRALEKAAEKELQNVLFITDYIHSLSEFFERGELSGLYLNFSDPWPKDRHAKRRLTHRGYLESYKEVLLPGSFIEFKTDNDGLFAFSVPEFEACGLMVEQKTDDLHRSDYPSKEIETEYEHKFRLLGNKIHYCRVRI